MRVLQIGRRPRSHRRHAFVPAWTSDVAGRRLESRALTAPAIFNRGISDPLRLRDTQAEIDNTTPAVPVLVDWQQNPSASNASFTLTQFAMGQTNLVLTGAATSSVLDNDTPNPPAAPVGNYAVAENMTSQILAVSPGPIPGLPLAMGTRTSSARNYVLADDSATPAGPVTLTEHYDVTYMPAAGTLMGSGILMNMRSSSVPGGIVIAGGGTGITGITLEGAVTIIPPATGTYTTSVGSLLTYTSSPGVVHIGIATSFPTGLPSTYGINPPVGVDWKIQFQDRLWVNAISSPGNTDSAKLTSHYDASF